MKTETLSINSRKAALHASVVLIVLAALMLILSAHTFAAASPDATGQVNASNGAYLRKSSTTGSKKVATLADNTALTIYREIYKSKKSTSKKNRWYYVKASNGKKGYIRADLVDNIHYSMVSGTVKSKVNIRKGPGTRMKKNGTLKKGTKVTIYMDSRPVYSTRGRSKVWYRIYHNGKYSFVCSQSIKVGAAISTASTVTPTQSQVNTVLNVTSNAFSKMTTAQFENYLTNQGFPEAYKVSLRKLHAQHPNWVFTAYHTGLNWTDVMKKETVYGVSLVHSSYPTSYRSTSKNSFSSYKMAAAAAAEPAAAEQTEAVSVSASTGSADAKAASDESAENTTEVPVTDTAETAETVAKDETVNVTDSAAAFDEVKAALESAEEGNAVPVTGTVVPETISVLIKAESGAPVLAELSKDAKVSIRSAAETPEQQEADDGSAEQIVTKWYEVEFDKSIAAEPANDSDTESTAPVYASEDQSEDKNLEAANDAAEQEIIGNEPEEAATSADAEEEAGAESDGTATSEEASEAFNADGSAMKGYVRAEDLEVLLKGSSSDSAKEAIKTDSDKPEEEPAQTAAENPADTAETETSVANETEASAADSETDAAETQDEETEIQIELASDTVTNEAKNAYYQVEPGWYNANANVVAYYMDPRNFLNEDRVYMFENLAYQSEYQTASVVNKIISGTKLPNYGFNANVFMNAGRKYNISPVFLAARVRQETGGNSASVNGSKSGGKVVYNPFNIGAYGSNPVAQGLAYAKKMGWTTPAKAVDGGASYLASGYINKKQNTIYFQRFNVANGLGNAGTHQYMTNVMAPYSEAHMTKTSYSQLGITNEPLGFVIPVYKNMPAKTKLP